MDTEPGLAIGVEEGHVNETPRILLHGQLSDGNTPMVRGQHRPKPGHDHLVIVDYGHPNGNCGAKRTDSIATVDPRHRPLSYPI